MAFASFEITTELIHCQVSSTSRFTCPENHVAWLITNH